jgi:hypothetical protein
MSKISLAQQAEAVRFAATLQAAIQGGGTLRELQPPRVAEFDTQRLNTAAHTLELFSQNEHELRASCGCWPRRAVPSCYTPRPWRRCACSLHRRGYHRSRRPNAMIVISSRRHFGLPLCNFLLEFEAHVKEQLDKRNILCGILRQLLSGVAFVQRLIRV